MSFGLTALAIAPAATRRYELLSIPSEPNKPWTLILRHAGESNAPFWNAQLKLANETTAKGGASAVRLTTAKIALVRSEWTELAARHVVAGWENVLEDGEPIACTPEAALRFLSELSTNAPDMFDALRRFAADAENFRGLVADPAAVGKA